MGWNAGHAVAHRLFVRQDPRARQGNADLRDDLVTTIRFLAALSAKEPQISDFRNTAATCGASAPPQAVHSPARAKSRDCRGRVRACPGCRRRVHAPSRLSLAPPCRQQARASMGSQHHALPGPPASFARSLSDPIWMVAACNSGLQAPHSEGLRCPCCQVVCDRHRGQASQPTTRSCCIENVDETREMMPLSLPPPLHGLTLTCCSAGHCSFCVACQTWQLDMDLSCVDERWTPPKDRGRVVSDLPSCFCTPDVDAISQIGRAHV